jgi:hypothetical protein
MAWWVWTVIAVAAVVALFAIWIAMRGRRSQMLRSRFGDEYQRTVDETGSREREQRRSELEIRPLTSAARERYAEQWRVTQEQFVDAPDAAVRQADTLVTAVMRERGYPVDDFGRRADDVSVDHPHVVADYREAQLIAGKSTAGTATTEELREAMVRFRSLFDELLGDTAVADTALTRDSADAERVDPETRIRAT